jgi:hypothetical protein
MIANDSQNNDSQNHFHDFVSHYFVPIKVAGVGIEPTKAEADGFTDRPLIQSGI